MTYTLQKKGKNIANYHQQTDVKNAIKLTPLATSLYARKMNPKIIIKHLVKIAY